jgi:diaminohydroxyphosphoribosylaminopyrimidine deaminase/5-amino-6-(5-phosphoribosylamino)uracil reductase
MVQKIFMQRCLELAALGNGKVAPNPLVGAVLVVDNKIIAEGYHQNFGGAHAEVNAINAVADQSLLSKATLYVNLEPCAHFGKTPPCVDLVINSGIRKVVVAQVDPFEKVAGNGIAKMQATGIEVHVGLMEAEAKWLNRRFLHFVNHKKPYVVLKWAQTMSGYIAPYAHQMSKEEFEEKRHITGLLVQKQVHKWRTEESAILVGRNTVVTDNPALNARAWLGKNPLRIVVDRMLKLDHSYKVFDGQSPTWIVNSVKAESLPNLEYVYVEPTENWTEVLLNKMYQAGHQSLIIEGGNAILNHVINSNLWQEAQVFYTPKHFKDGVLAPHISGYLAETFELDQSIFKRYIND